MDENIVVIGDKVMNFDSNSQMASQDSGTKLTNLRQKESIVAHKSHAYRESVSQNEEAGHQQSMS